MRASRLLAAIRKREWRRCASKYPHTTHELSFPKIEYRHHPFYGAEVKVVRTVRRFPDEIDIVQLPQGLQIAVPRWMLDPLACSQLPQEVKPRVALSALLRIAELLQRQRLPISSGGSLSDTSPPTKGHHVSRQNPTLSSSPLATSQEDALGSVPRSHASSVSPSVDPNAASSRAHCLEGKGQP